MKLIFCEKKAAAQSIAQALHISNDFQPDSIQDKDYIFLWSDGHLLETVDYKEYDTRYTSWSRHLLPIIPDHYRYRPVKGKAKRIKEIKKWFDDERIDEIINAADCGREGEVIFWEIYYYCACKKPVTRLWIDSLEEDEILRGMNERKPGKTYLSLFSSGLCRQRADELIGRNFTRLFSDLYKTTLPVGRVQSTVLKMIVDRDQKIENFTPVSKYRLKIKYRGIEFNDDPTEDFDEVQTKQREIEKLQFAIGKTNSKKERRPSPNLFDLTSLMAACSDLFKMKPAETSKIAQSLYEKKYISYPRTDSQYLPESMESVIQKICSRLKEKYRYTRDLQFKKVIDNAMVSDHYAIIPTISAVFTKTDDYLNARERMVMDLIEKRTLTAVAPDHLLLHHQIPAIAKDYIFKATYTDVIDEGWRTLWKQRRKQDIQEGFKQLEEGIYFIPEDIVIHLSKTTPPTYFTYSSLLTAMDKAGNDSFKQLSNDPQISRTGLGTPSTRSQIIQSLEERELINVKNNKIVSTLKGKELIKNLPGEVCKVDMTIMWEKRLTEIYRKVEDPKKFLKDIENYVSLITEEYKNIDIQPDKEIFQPEKTIYGNCPLCGGEIYKAYSGKNWYCANYKKGCKFYFPSIYRFFENKIRISDQNFQALLRGDTVKITYKDRNQEKKESSFVAKQNGVYMNLYRIKSDKPI